jgi:hypothetical protein
MKSAEFSSKGLEFRISFDQGFLSDPAEGDGQFNVVSDSFSIQDNPIAELSVPDPHTRLQR